MKIVMGLDPGLSGAACLYDVARSTVINVIDMPTEPWGTKTHIDVAKLLQYAHRYGVDTAALERVNAMPSIGAGGERRGMGAASAFRFGMCFGEIRGALIGNGIKVVDVPPKQWKDLFELNGRPKDDARTLAISLFPDMAVTLKRKKDIGRAESMLIARWAVQNRWEGK